MRVIAGLGNPGAAYARHRHNVGWRALDRIHRAYAFEGWRTRLRSLTADGRIGEARTLLVKPQTFMNDSGEAVRAVLAFHKLGVDALSVIHDDLDLAPGRVKVKRGGGAGGHNGLRSLDSHVGQNYQRVRFGIGHPGHRDQVTPYVLGDFAKADAEWVGATLDAVVAELPWLLADDPERFVSEVARRTG